jgi:hypothetical protein
MGHQCFVAYSIRETDAHMVYELGGLMEQQGYTPYYQHTHPEHPRGQHSYDQVALSMFFVGLVTTSMQANMVLQLWQYARSQGIPAVVLIEEGITIHSSLARSSDIIRFRRFMPENPIKYIELWMSHHLR